ncbi:Ras-related protein Rab-5C [Tritrichomonas foetus]|uniref:Ras-related protein Rab-5C n=1 Tax=Tritrichomonas foetus TaxID=1144522 RepID=A0A1J4J888_9EUKA|nr:Ras-related protein Rab-5C [Tritrichomonas foetus]|eukprot:OHS94897.1 Ras-related protein Rab-5C [Tritrichomonas foetus]
MTERIKVVLVGDSGVGKTSIIKRFTENENDFHNIQPTVGCEGTEFVMNNNGIETVLEIYDTAGQEVYQSLAPIYYRGAQVCLLVFSNNSVSSLNSIKKWAENVQNSNTNCKFLLICNKADLPEDPAITSQKVEDMRFDTTAIAKFHASALTGMGIDEIFEFIVKSDEIGRNQGYLGALTDEEKQRLAGGGLTYNNNNSQCC